MVLYCIRYVRHREDELKKKPFGGWYFIFELTLSFMVGLIPASLLGLFFFHDYWASKKDIPFLMLVVICASSVFLFFNWFRFSGYALPFGKGSFVPFLRENLGKKPYPETGENRSKKVRLSPLFMGCGISFLSSLSIIIGLLLIWSDL